MRTMMMAGTVMLLVSCSGGEEKGGNAAANGAAAANQSAASTPQAGGNAAGATAQLSPGRWETTVEILRMDMPNMPPGAALPKQGPITVRSCLTPEQARRPTGGFMTGGRDQAGCNYENFAMTGGRVQGTVTCNHQGSRTRSTVNGTFSAEAYRMEIDAEVESSGVTVRTANRITGRRIGDCTPEGGN